MVEKLPYDEEAAVKAVLCARNWWLNRTQGHRKFAYRNGKTFLHDDTAPLNNDFGEAIIDCSTFITLVLLGYNYEDSPYALVKDPNEYFPIHNLRLGDTDWADKNFWMSTYNHSDGRYTAASLCYHYYQRGRCFYDMNQLKPGDLIFFSGKENNRFMDVTHVAIADMDTDRFFHVSYQDDIVTRRLLLSREDEIVCFARPEYGTGRQGKVCKVSNILERPYCFEMKSSNQGILKENGAVWRLDGPVWMPIIRQLREADKGAWYTFWRADPTGENRFGLYLPSGFYNWNTHSGERNLCGVIGNPFYRPQLILDQPVPYLVNGFDYSDLGSEYWEQTLLRKREGFSNIVPENGFGTYFIVPKEGRILYEYRNWFSVDQMVSPIIRDMQLRPFLTRNSPLID